MKYRTVCFIIYLILLAACSKKEVDSRQAVLAEVGGEVITVGELLDMMPDEEIEDGSSNQKTAASEIEALKHGLLDQLINQKMLLQEARRLNIALTESEFKNQKDLLQNGMDETTFFELLAEQNISRTAWEKATRENLITEKLLDQFTREEDGDALSLSEETVRAYYEKNPKEWHVDEQLKLRQIVVDSEEKARSLRTQIVNGADFSDTAKIHSMQTHTEDGEGLGYVTLAEVPVEFEPLFKLDIGSVSEVIKTPFGYHLVLIEDKRGEQILPYEEIREKLYQQLLDRKREHVFSKWIEKLRLRTEVRINEELLKSVS